MISFRLAQRAAPLDRRAGGVVVLALASGLPSCMPLVLHGPQVQEGPRFPISVAAAFLPESRDDAELAPFFTVGFAHSWVGQSSAFSAGVQVPVIPYLEAIRYAGAVDLYVQPDVAHPAGAGFVASQSFLMPYVQIGRTGETGITWFTTQGISFTRAEFEQGTYWMPSVAVRDQREDGSRAATFHLSAGVPLHAHEWIMAIGLFVEFGRAREP